MNMMIQNLIRNRFISCIINIIMDNNYLIIALVSALIFIILVSNVIIPLFNRCMLYKQKGGADPCNKENAAYYFIKTRPDLGTQIVVDDVVMNDNKCNYNIQYYDKPSKTWLKTQIMLDGNIITNYMNNPTLPTLPPSVSIPITGCNRDNAAYYFVKTRPDLGTQIVINNITKNNNKCIYDIEYYDKPNKSWKTTQVTLGETTVDDFLKSSANPLTPPMTPPMTQPSTPPMTPPMTPPSTPPMTPPIPSETIRVPTKQGGWETLTQAQLDERDLICKNGTWRIGARENKDYMTGKYDPYFSNCVYVNYKNGKTDNYEWGRIQRMLL